MKNDKIVIGVEYPYMSFDTELLPNPPLDLRESKA